MHIYISIKFPSADGKYTISHDEFIDNFESLRNVVDTFENLYHEEKEKEAKRPIESEDIPF